MKIPTNIGKRIIKSMKFKPELQKPFIQGDYEYITNSFYMVKVPKQADQKEDDRQLPKMKRVEETCPPKGDILRFNNNLLIDMLTIMKNNDCNYIDLQIGENSITCKGLVTWLDKDKIDVSGILMKVSN